MSQGRRKHCVWSNGEKAKPLCTYLQITDKKRLVKTGVFGITKGENKQGRTSRERLYDIDRRTSKILSTSNNLWGYSLTTHEHVQEMSPWIQRKIICIWSFIALLLRLSQKRSPESYGPKWNAYTTHANSFLLAVVSLRSDVATRWLWNSEAQILPQWGQKVQLKLFENLHECMSTSATRSLATCSDADVRFLSLLAHVELHNSLSAARLSRSDSGILHFPSIDLYMTHYSHER